MVYVSTQSLSTASRQSLMQTQSDLTKAQQELSSGKLADVGLELGKALDATMRTGEIIRRIRRFVTRRPAEAEVFAPNRVVDWGCGPGTATA